MEDIAARIKAEEAEIDDEMEEDEGDYNDSLAIVDPDTGAFLDQNNIVSSTTSCNDHHDHSCHEQCAVCLEHFSCKDALRNHLVNAHINQCCWTCTQCGAVFDDVEDFKLHLIKNHKISKDVFTSDDPNVNPVLSPKFTLKSVVVNCNECDARFCDEASLNLHRLKKHISTKTAGNVPCPICGEKAQDLTAHVRSAHGVEGVCCPQCGKILSKQCTLNRHMEQVHLNLQIHKPATCTECGKVFSKKGHLDRHIKTIHRGIKEKSNPCPYCGKVFSTKSSLEPHIEMVHKGVRKECPECGKVLSDLWKHMRTVHGLYRRRTKIPKDAVDAKSVDDILEPSESSTSPAPVLPAPKIVKTAPNPVIKKINKKPAHTHTHKQLSHNHNLPGSTGNSPSHSSDSPSPPLPPSATAPILPDYIKRLVNNAMMNNDNGNAIGVVHDEDDDEEEDEEEQIPAPSLGEELMLTPSVMITKIVRR